MHTILLTGFTAFGTETVNPSWQAVSALHQWQPDADTRVHALQLPCVFDESLQLLAAAIDQFQPVLVIAVGQAGGRCAFSLEKVAINYDDARIADNKGQQPLGRAIDDKGPAAYFTTLPVKAIIQRLRQQGIPAELSFSAGTFVCNHVFYGLMQQLASQPAVRGGFIHIPYNPAQACRHQAPSMSLDLVIAALKTSIELSLQTTPDIELATGQLD